MKGINSHLDELLDTSSTDDVSQVKLVDFGMVPVDSIVEKIMCIENTTDKALTYRISLMYILNSIDHCFKALVTDKPVKCGSVVDVKLIFRPNSTNRTFTEYFLLEDSCGKSYRITASGGCYGPEVYLDKKKIKFDICKTVSENRRVQINIINRSNVDSTYQWLLPVGGQANFHIPTGNCGLIRAYETITTTVVFTGVALGVYTAELVCLVLNQEPLYLNAVASVKLSGGPSYDINAHVFEKSRRKMNPTAHLMENSLNRLSYIPSASVFERYLDFGMGSVLDVTKNISQTLCVTNHEQCEGYIQWVPDPDYVFLIDPIGITIPPNESRSFTVRFRPKIDNEVYSYLMCGDFQYQFPVDEENETIQKTKHAWFRITCIGNTWAPCTEWSTEWDCPTEVVLPPTVPGRSTFKNFMLANKLDVPMYFKFEAPYGTEVRLECIIRAESLYTKDSTTRLLHSHLGRPTACSYQLLFGENKLRNFVMMPMCGIVSGRGWQIISVALEPKSFGEYYETWDLFINKSNKVCVILCGNAEISKVEVMSYGYYPSMDAMYEFPPTITGCTNYCTAYLHNLTRMDIHMRVLNYVPWLGADEAGCIVIPPKEIVRYHWWFFPKTPNKVYETTITCSCVCLINGQPVGEPTEIFINITGFSEYPDLRVIAKLNNLQDIVVGESKTVAITLYNFGTCYFTSKLFHTITGLGDDFSGDRFEIDSTVNSLKPQNFCQVLLTVTPNDAGPRKIKLRYTVLYRTEYEEVQEIHSVRKAICTVWYHGIYPTLKVKRTISVKAPIILSNHCVWNLMNVDDLNKAFEDCRPNKPLDVTLYAPDLCIRTSSVDFIFVIGCIYNVPASWIFCRQKICDCKMVEVKTGISTYTMKHTCVHRPLVELSPLSGMASPRNPSILKIKFKYAFEDWSTLCFVLSLSNQRSINVYFRLFAHVITRGVLVALRRPVGMEDYLTVLDCGRVPINNLDHVIRIAWLYNPTDVFATWRLLRGNTISLDAPIRCLLFFAEVPPLGKLSIPFAFMPTEMVNYEAVFMCSFGYENLKILVKGEGGLPNCHEMRLDMPFYVERHIRSTCRENTVYLSKDHITLPVMTTHLLHREIIAICNDTDNTLRYIWLPERLANIANIIMTPCWGVIHPKTTEWITMTVYTLQEPSTFTTLVSCEMLDLTKRKIYQRNEALRRMKMETCQQEFIITEEGVYHPDVTMDSRTTPLCRGNCKRCEGNNSQKCCDMGSVNDEQPFVEDIKKPQPFYLSFSVSLCSKGQRDGYPRMLLKQMWELTPPFDLLTSDWNDDLRSSTGTGNNISMPDVIRIIDGILWDALHSKMFKNQIKYYAKEEIPTYDNLVAVMKTEKRPCLSRRVTAGICDAIVNKAVFYVYSLCSKNRDPIILEAE